MATDFPYESYDENSGLDYGLTVWDSSSDYGSAVRWAYFCRVGDLHHSLRQKYPLKQLVTLLEISHNETFFPLSEISRVVLTKNMTDLSCIEKNVKPHSLRIGGHTYYTVYGLEPGFRDYLARRKVNKSVQTYYRASPHLTICKLRNFFEQTYKQ